MARANDIAVRVEHVSKDFALPQEKITSIKGLFMSFYKLHRNKKGVQHALTDVSFDIKKGEFFGIVGRNGSGKSTMLKILAGIYQPSRGRIAVDGRLIPFIELGVGFNPELSGRENVYLNGAIMGFSDAETSAMYNDIVAFAELEGFMDQKLKNYSSGMQVRLAFSVAIRAEADVLLIDEVLAVGDAAFQRKCFDHFKTLKKQGKTVVFVSHDMNAVREFCDRAVLLSSKGIVIGSAAEIAKRYARQFLEEGSQRAGAATNASADRWGNGPVGVAAAHVTPTLYEDDKELKITATLETPTAAEDIVAGITIKDSLGRALCGTNTLLKDVTLPNLRAGERLKLEWVCPNIFPNGKYTIDLTVHKPDGVTVFDWWEEALTFESARRETIYPAEPAIRVRIIK